MLMTMLFRMQSARNAADDGKVIPFGPNFGQLFLGPLDLASWHLTWLPKQDFSLIMRGTINILPIILLFAFASEIDERPRHTSKLNWPIH